MSFSFSFLIKPDTLHCPCHVQVYGVHLLHRICSVLCDFLNRSTLVRNFAQVTHCMLVSTYLLEFGHSPEDDTLYMSISKWKSLSCSSFSGWMASYWPLIVFGFTSSFLSKENSQLDCSLPCCSDAYAIICRSI